ncbi:MAG: hypothetical protein GOV01_04000 [Candidatus Altiarchaeota archaeon]|nr:hypothetical protein [Candidatus Altiarchaeota archaeon]
MLTIHPLPDRGIFEGKIIESDGKYVINYSANYGEERESINDPALLNTLSFLMGVSAKSLPQIIDDEEATNRAYPTMVGVIHKETPSARVAPQLKTVGLVIDQDEIEQGYHSFLTTKECDVNLPRFGSELSRHTDILEITRVLIDRYNPVSKRFMGVGNYADVVGVSNVDKDARPLNLDIAEDLFTEMYDNYGKAIPFVFGEGVPVFEIYSSNNGQNSYFIFLVSPDGTSAAVFESTPGTKYGWHNSLANMASEILE